MSLLAALEQAIVVCNQIEEVIDIKPKIEAFIDNNDAYEAIHSLKQEMKGRLRIDIGCIKEMVMVTEKEVESITLVPASLQLADCLTKRGASTKPLIRTLNTGCFSH